MDNEDIFEQEISNIENLFVNGVAFQNINDTKINSKLDFFEEIYKFLHLFYLF